MQNTASFLVRTSLDVLYKCWDPGFYFDLKCVGLHFLTAIPQASKKILILCLIEYVYLCEYCHLF